MKTLLILFSILLSSNLFSQEYRKDSRSQIQKEDEFSNYQGDNISMTKLLKALEIAGVRVFNYPLKAFDKEYKVSVYINEYVDGKKVDSKDVFNHYGKNTYMHSGDLSPDERDKYYIDYIDHITFYTKDIDTASILSIETYSVRIGGQKLVKKKDREDQFYIWRRYSKADWILNQEVPLLVFASSWHDKRFNIERFCGVADLSNNEEDTKELLDSSPHYYIVTYKVVE